MTNDALVLILMVLIFAVFVWAVRRGGPLPPRTYVTIMLACAIVGASTASDIGDCSGSESGQG